MRSLSDLWKNVLDSMAVTLSDTTIRTWFDEVDIVTMEDSAIVLHCGNDFKKDIIEKRFMDDIKAALQDTFSANLEVKLLDDKALSAYHGVRPDHPDQMDVDQGFTFDTYVVGPQNKMAYSASRFVSENPGQKYNPLFIYGDSGLGKTHLLYAIRHQTYRLHPEKNIVYIKGEEFINEFIELVRAGRGDEFRAKYRDADVLLVDDIQFVAGKEQVQNEFFHTFNTLHEAGRQIVLTSDRPPREMSLLDDRLRTRFEWGLMADVAPPDYETRMAIIKNKSTMLGIKLPEKVMDFIAENVTANVRQIEGTLTKILAYRDLLGDRVDEDTISRAIEDMLKKDNEYVPTPAIIVEYVSKYFQQEEDELRGQSRGRDITNARQIAMYLIRRMTKLSLNDIGREFGGRDHTTVLHSLDKVEKQMRTDAAFAETVKMITTNINAKR